MNDYSFLAFLCQTIGLICGAVWIVGSIKSTTAVLNNTILNLKEAMQGLEKALNRIYEIQNEHETRITVLEKFGDGNNKHERK